MVRRDMVIRDMLVGRGRCGLQTGAVHTEFYTDADLAVGTAINVWGRKFVLGDCDEFTREYYRTKYGVSTCHPGQLSSCWVSL